MASSGSSNQISSHQRKVIVVTGPPLNGRDEYLNTVVSMIKETGRSVGYHHVFEEMQKIAPRFKISNLSRANVLDLSSNTLRQIRSAAYESIIENLRNSANDYDFVSTPGTFRVKPSPSSPDGKIIGLELQQLSELRPDLVVIFIADLLEVKQNLYNDTVWRERVDSDLKILAEWRRESIDLIARDAQPSVIAQNKEPLDYVIYAKAHDPQTFVDLCLAKKPRIYISFSITQASDSEKKKVQEIKSKLEEHFACLDPYSIKDWEIITAHDNALESGKDKVEIYSAGISLERREVEDAIDELRAQTVQRDYSLVSNSHGTVVLHVTEIPSYGVMSEIIYTRSTANNPVYVLYPFKKRPSPFFEYYVSRDHVIQNEDLDACTDALISKMLVDISADKWPRWKAPSK